MGEGCLNHFEGDLCCVAMATSRLLQSQLLLQASSESYALVWSAIVRFRARASPSGPLPFQVCRVPGLWRKSLPPRAYQ
jgi:hypothetical protein